MLATLRCMTKLILYSELQNTEMLRSDFVNNFSHEFKTPIVSLRGFARLLQRGDLTEEQRRERRREHSRDYRRRKKTYDYEPVKGKKYREYLKGVKTMGVDIPPSQLPAFFAYMDYRFAQGAGSKKYVFDIFVDDFQEMLQKGYKPDQLQRMQFP